MTCSVGELLPDGMRIDEHSVVQRQTSYFEPTEPRQVDMNPRKQPSHHPYCLSFMSASAHRRVAPGVLDAECWC